MRAVGRAVGRTKLEGLSFLQYLVTFEGKSVMLLRVLRL